MSRSIRVAQRATRQVSTPIADLPVFLCPGLLRVAAVQHAQYSIKQPRSFSQTSLRKRPALNSEEALRQKTSIIPVDVRTLPRQCAGCGALSQAVDQESPGFYTLTRKSLRQYLDGSSSSKHAVEDEIVRAALENAGEAATGLVFEAKKEKKASVANVEPPLCDRCHALKHHEVGVSIQHPSISSLEDTISESPYKYNHVYHVVDAADFPMSLVPGIHKLLNLTKQRSKNRRAKHDKFYADRKTEISFIITRSDLLAPTKEQVDRMMPYLRDTLRDALGRAGRDARLGNVRCVSAKNNWWTKELKEDIWKRGGGGWLVGKVNVGKSRLFHDIFPKGRSDGDKSGNNTSIRDALEDINAAEEVSILKSLDLSAPKLAPTSNMEDEDSTDAVGYESLATSSNEDTDALKDLEGAPTPIPTKANAKEDDNPDVAFFLPPAPPETDYPPMPLVSSLPGTTASPIRLLFGNGKGELIDLPGLRRGDLELHIQPEHRSELVMRSRIKPEQITLKPGKSLLLGGFIRITPLDSDVIILACAFTPIKPHRTSTEKAVGTQTETRESTVENIALTGTGEKIKSAGIYHLKWDVTRERAGPVTDPKAVGIRPENLPYRILATDILIEGCGWVELVAQISKRRRVGFQSSIEEEKVDEARWDYEPEKKEVVDPSWPSVEIFTPEGKFIGSRRPMNAWMLYAKKPGQTKMKSRPRKSMKGVKKEGKRRSRLGSLM